MQKSPMLNCTAEFILAEVASEGVSVIVLKCSEVEEFKMHFRLGELSCTADSNLYGEASGRVWQVVTVGVNSNEWDWKVQYIS